MSRLILLADALVGVLAAMEGTAQARRVDDELEGDES